MKSKGIVWSIMIGLCVLWWYGMFVSPVTTVIWTFIIIAVSVIGIKIKEETRI